MTVDEFAHKGYRAYMRCAPHSNQPVFLEDSRAEWESGLGVWYWVSNVVNGPHFNRATHAAIVYPDGSAQLLSRDEAECRLFTTLWELGR